jgi:transposase
VAREPARPRPVEARVHRRDLGQDEHDAHARPLPVGRAVGRGRPARALADHDADRGPGRLGHALRDDALDGPVNRAAFEAFVASILVPTLSAGDVVVMDNLSSHKGPRVRELIEAVGAQVVYLPPYSPDLNPIELAFAKLKQLMRSAAHRTADALWADVQRMLNLITPGDAGGFFRHCGYGRTLEVR